MKTCRVVIYCSLYFSLEICHKSCSLYLSVVMWLRVSKHKSKRYVPFHYNTNNILKISTKPLWLPNQGQYNILWYGSHCCYLLIFLCCGFCFVCLRSVCHVPSVSVFLDFPFLITFPVFSNVYLIVFLYVFSIKFLLLHYLILP
jgi:hypothetical protein